MTLCYKGTNVHLLRIC